MPWLVSVTTNHHISCTFIVPPQVKRMSSSIQFRDATPADYDDVMNINDNIYEGHDYLPSYYHDFCKDPQCHMFVAEDEGKVVSRVLYGDPFCWHRSGIILGMNSASERWRHSHWLSSYIEWFIWINQCCIAIRSCISFLNLHDDVECNPSVPCLNLRWSKGMDE